MKTAALLTLLMLSGCVQLDENYRPTLKVNDRTELRSRDHTLLIERKF